MKKTDGVGADCRLTERLFVYYNHGENNENSRFQHYKEYS